MFWILIILLVAFFFCGVVSPFLLTEKNLYTKDYGVDNNAYYIMAGYVVIAFIIEFILQDKILN